MIGALKGANLAVPLLLEVVALLAFAFWGWTVGTNDAAPAAAHRDTGRRRAAVTAWRQ